MLVRAAEERFTTPAQVAADAELLIGSQAGTTNFYVAVPRGRRGLICSPRRSFRGFPIGS